MFFNAVTPAFTVVDGILFIIVFLYILVNSYFSETVPFKLDLTSKNLFFKSYQTPLLVI